MYLVLSIFCTTLNEMFASWMSLRADTLKAALAQIIDDPQVKGLFYGHGLIDTAKVASSGGKTPPNDNAGENRADVASVPHPSYIDSKSAAMALIDSVISAKNVAAGTVATAQQFQTALLALPPSNLRDALLSCEAQAQNDIVKLRDTIAAWFDSTMDRLQGDYKRYLQNITLVVAFVLVVIFNADTLHVATALWADPALSSMAAQAGVDMAKQTNTDSIGTATDSTCGKSPEDKNDTIGRDTNRLCQLNSDLRPLPIGWEEGLGPLSKSGPFSEAFLLWAGLKLMGFILSIIAISVGAPFWFDMLSKFVNLRGAGTKPAASTS
jgi:hypothetical protein